MDEDLDYHRKPLDEYFGELKERQSTFVAAATGVVNHSIDAKRLGDPLYPHHQDVPCCLYFYYVRINTDGKLVVTHYFYPDADPDDDEIPANPADWPRIDRDPAVLSGLLRDMALNARQIHPNPAPIGERFEVIKWRRKSYIAVFVDELDWKLHRDPVTGDPCVVFMTDPKDGKVGMDNHTFFDAMDLQIEMPISGTTSTDFRSACVFINHMKADDLGNDLGRGAGQYFQFKIFFDVAYATGGTGMTVIFDPGGTNMGPPIPPP